MEKISIEVTQTGDRNINVVSEGEITVKDGNKTLIKVVNSEYISSMTLINTLLGTLNYSDVKYYVGSRYVNGGYFMYVDLTFKSGEQYRVTPKEIQDNPKESKIKCSWSIEKLDKTFREHIGYIKEVERAIIEHNSTVKTTVLSY